MKLGKLNLERHKKMAQFALYGLLLFIGFAIADLTIIYVRDFMIPSEAPPKKMSKMAPANYIDRSQYSAITNRNLFASSGIMPEAITSRKENSTNEAAPILSTLPLNLIGTLVHSDPAKSIAAIEVKSKSLTGSYVTGAEVEGLAKIEKVERGIVYIRNLNTSALEYIELKNANKVSFDASKTTAAVSAAPASKDVQQLGNNTFQIKRSDLLKYTNDLSSVLMQARAVPNRDPNTGEINGFRILDMQDGSIFQQLGLQRMDVLKGVNGEAIDSVQKAMELYNTLKNGNQVKLQVERGGKIESMTYDVK